jgi:hypothetical protein
MAQTLKFGNGTWATKKDSILAYNDENENYKPLPFNYTGFGKGTRVNKEGLIEVVENDRPRIDYLDSEDGVFLLEDFSTNLITYSEDFSNSVWDLLDASIENNSTLLTPQGINGVQELKENSDNDDHLIKSSAAFTKPTSTLSIFAKYKDNDRNIKLSLGTNKYASFNLKDGYIFDVETTTIAKIEKYSNGWYRCSITGGISSSELNIILLNDVNEVYQGDGTSGVYIWGAQFEDDNLSSYIPTQGSIQTRVAETASGSGNSEVFNDSEGILYVEGSLINDDGTSNNITLGDNTFSNNRMMLLFSNGIANRITARFDSSGSDVTLNADGYDLTLNHKVVLKYKANDIAIWVDGFEVNSGNSFSAPTLLNRIDFYNPFNSGEDNFYGKTKEIGYYDEILTDLELETLTSYRSWLSMVKELNLNVIYNG